MSKPLHPQILFRLSVIGQLASRQQLAHGEIKKIARELAQQTYQIPGSRRLFLSESTILRWYYDWKKNSIDGLNPKIRADKGKSHLSSDIQDALLTIKQANPAKSIHRLICTLEEKGIVGKNTLSRATVHRFLKHKNLSQRILADKATIERRAFLAAHCGDIWYGDVMHGPSIQTPGGMRKVYLVSLMDDASRLIVHSEFCLGETALDIEHVLKQSVLKRGLPHKLVVDNGAAYKSATLQSICARLEIRLVYCRPYEPEGKGKLERWHRTFREQFLGEIHIESIQNLSDLNARLWSWLDQFYHRRPHTGLSGKTPLDRWREDLVHVRQLGFKAGKIDDIFYHRVERTIRKDGTLSWEGKFFEVVTYITDKKVILVIDPYTQKAIRIESISGDDLGAVVPLDKLSNLHRRRQRPHDSQPQSLNPYASTASKKSTETKVENLVELVFKKHQKQLEIPFKNYQQTNQ